VAETAETYSSVFRSGNATYGWLLAVSVFGDRIPKNRQTTHSKSQGLATRLRVHLTFDQQRHKSTEVPMRAWTSESFGDGVLAITPTGVLKRSSRVCPLEKKRQLACRGPRSRHRPIKADTLKAIVESSIKKQRKRSKKEVDTSDTSIDQPKTSPKQPEDSTFIQAFGPHRVTLNRSEIGRRAAWRVSAPANSVDTSVSRTNLADFDEASWVRQAIGKPTDRESVNNVVQSACFVGCGHVGQNSGSGPRDDLLQASPGDHLRLKILSGRISQWTGKRELIRKPNA